MNVSQLVRKGIAHLDAFMDPVYAVGFLTGRRWSDPRVLRFVWGLRPPYGVAPGSMTSSDAIASALRSFRTSLRVLHFSHPFARQ